MTIQDYLNAFDHWLSQHIHAAVKAGKDFAFRDRAVNSALRLDDDGAAWDYIFLEPGAAPPPGHAWTVYRLHGVDPAIASPKEARAPGPDRQQRAMVADLAQAVFGPAASAKTKGRHLRAVV